MTERLAAMSASRWRASFAELVGLSHDDVPLDRASLLIAAEEYDAISIETYLRKLDELAERVATHLHADAGPHETLTQMRFVLIEQEGFAGNSDEYYDPRNSFLNEVLDRKLGIPIALSAVYMEVGRRIGFRLEGVGYPGHFLVKHSSSTDDIIIDPFHQARVVGENDLQSRLNDNFGGKVRHTPELLRAITTRQVLYRMLSNLKSIYVRERDPKRALAAVERMLILAPENGREHRDRGVLLAQQARPIEALSALARYRELEPDAADADAVDTMVEQLKTRIGMAN